MTWIDKHANLARLPPFSFCLFTFSMGRKRRDALPAIPPNEPGFNPRCMISLVRELSAIHCSATCLTLGNAKPDRWERTYIER